jgi:hypothetical protein
MATKPELLDYKHSESHFIYAFMWLPRSRRPGQEGWQPSDLKESAFRDLSDQRQSDPPGQSPLSDWQRRLLHERQIGSIDGDRIEARWVGNYQPTFLTNRYALELKLPPESASVVVPLVRNPMPLPLAGHQLPDGYSRSESLATFPVNLEATLRLFESFTGTLTVRVSIAPDVFEDPDSSRGYELIHWVLHLISNMDDEWTDAQACDGRPITDTYLFQNDRGTFRLFDYMRKARTDALARFPTDLFSGPAHLNSIQVASEAFAYRHVPRPEGSSDDELTQYTSTGNRNWHENQSPFVVTNLVLESGNWQQAMGREPKDAARDQTAYELAAILTRLTMENGEILDKFQNVNFSYIRDVLAYDTNTHGLRNLCLDRRVFFAFSKRGALTLTHEPRSTPAMFVVPSFLNLFEILRSRMVAGVALTSELSTLAATLGRLGSTAARPSDDEYVSLLSRFRALRHRVVSQMQNPIHFLFDGGSITEAAIAAERDLFITPILASAEKGIDAIESLFSVWNLERSAVRFQGD